VALRELSDFVWGNIFDAPFINNAGRNVATSDQVAQPFSRIWVDLVVIGAHFVQLQGQRRRGDCPLRGLP
jgi:hypothetical protein